MKLLFNALVKFAVGLVLVGMLLFLPAGGFGYVNGWLFIGLLFLPMLLLGVVLLLKAPALLQKRLDGKEKETTQKGVVGLSGLLFVASFVVAGLDHRFGWSTVPWWVVLIAGSVLLASYGLYAEVMRENAWLSRTVEVHQGQQVVDTGLYGVVRHPMYAVTILLFLSIPVVLGSWWALLCMTPYPVVMIARIRNEETVLERDLPGYGDYQKRVKYRLLPFVW